MKHIEFIKAVSEYYGEYSSKLVERITFEYIQDRFKESDLENVFKTIIIKVNPKFKTPPSPADFEEFFPRENMEQIAAEWYDKISRTGNSLDNVIISDIRAHKALLSIGGWVAHCSRNPEYENLHRKNFISAYSKIIVDNNDVIQVQYGESSRKHEKEPILIGDREKCIQIANVKEQHIPIDFIKTV
jgi:hypothetical protein